MFSCLMEKTTRHHEGKGSRKAAQPSGKREHRAPTNHDPRFLSTGNVYRATYRVRECSTISGRTRGAWSRVVQLTVESTKPAGKKGMGMKSQETKVQPLSVPLSPEQEKLLSRIASRLLNLRAGTPVTYTRKNLGPRRGLLDNMMTAKVLRIVGGHYVPPFRGIEQLDDDIRRVVRGNLNCVIGALQRLYQASGDQYTFPFEAIVEETKRHGPTRDANDVLPALIIGEEFGYHYFQEGIQEQNDHFVVQSATVVERIMDFTSVDEDWATKIAQEQVERSRILTVPASTPDSSAASRKADDTMPDFRFMQHAKLKKIVERDYSELQRVKTVGAAKSRLVLCGGLIEALLLDALLRDEQKANSATRSPKLKGGIQVKPLVEWNLGEVIDVAVELRVIETDAQQFSHGVRNYRNLIHPGKEMQSNQKVATEEADISEKVLEIVIRELGSSTKP
jgi:hypothetical protein